MDQSIPSEEVSNIDFSRDNTRIHDVFEKVLEEEISKLEKESGKRVMYQKDVYPVLIAIIDSVLNEMSLDSLFYLMENSQDLFLWFKKFGKRFVCIWMGNASASNRFMAAVGHDILLPMLSKRIQELLSDEQKGSLSHIGEVSQKVSNDTTEILRKSE